MIMAEKSKNPWEEMIPEGSFITTEPTYEVGKYFNLYNKDKFQDLNYYFYDPTEHGYPAKDNYPLLIFLHGTSNALVGETCINYCGAEYYASPKYQADFGGAYVLIPMANEYKTDEGTKGYWDNEYTKPLYALINDFISKHTNHVGMKFLFGNSSGATMTLRMGTAYPDYFDALIPIGSTAFPDKNMLNYWDSHNVHLFAAIAQKDEFHDWEKEMVPILDDLRSMKNCFLFTPEWVYNGDKGIASINVGFEMGQHCLINSVQSNLMFDDGTPMDERLQRGMTGWINEINRL